jgi:hypothetical protein
MAFARTVTETLFLRLRIHRSGAQETLRWSQGALSVTGVIANKLMAYEQSAIAKLDNPEIFKGIAELLCGKRLGSGCSRTVFQCKVDRSLVVKIEEDPEWHHQNIMEWEVWQHVEYNKKINKWFAPCIALSPCGRILLQKKVKFRDVSTYPAKIPAFFTDFQATNYGFLGKQFVCSDYGLMLHDVGLGSKRLKKVDWSKENGS